MEYDLALYHIARSQNREKNSESVGNTQKIFKVSPEYVTIFMPSKLKNFPQCQRLAASSTSNLKPLKRIKGEN
jgi:hypothetical protein